VTDRPKLKICGVTNPDDARLVSGSGADYCGILVQVGFSERTLTLETGKDVAREAFIPVVILLCDPDRDLAETVAQTIQPYALQLLGRETPEFVQDLKNRCSCQVWKTVHLSGVDGQASPQEFAQAGADALLIDSADAGDGKLRFGGTGKVGDWDAAAEVVRHVPIPVFLAGGIGPDNVEAALLAVRPFGIDLCSGVEAVRGRKDPEKVKNLLINFKAALTKLERNRL